MKNFKHPILKLLLVLILLIFFIIISAYSYVSAVSYNISDSVFRLHVIANSDSDADQNLKYKVRDNIIKYMNTLLPNITSKQEVIQIANDHINDFYNIANQTITSEGFSYSVNIKIGKYNFPTKTYGDVSFPAGIYDALRIEIGNANGHNWWCVMFPPLCFVDVTSGVVPEESKSLLKDSMGNEEYELVTADTSSNSEVSVKFKIVEMIENLKNTHSNSKN